MKYRCFCKCVITEYGRNKIYIVPVGVWRGGVLSWIPQIFSHDKDFAIMQPTWAREE